MTSFAKQIVKWQPIGGRNNLIWKTQDPYDVWLSEIMLQQTQVSTVIPRFMAFKSRFPTVDSLAASSEEDVLAEWSGLGYYRRARMLRLCAIELVAYINQFGSWPQYAHEWVRLPGIGRSTAAAITSACFGEKVSILDANAKRVIARYHGLNIEDDLWEEAEKLVKPLSKKDMPFYTQGLMDIGATYCKARSTNCDSCPLKNTCASTNNVVHVKSVSSVPKKQIIFQYGFVRKNDHVLMMQRNDHSFWPNMWTFPELSTSKKPSFEVRHLLSHRELVLQIFNQDDITDVQGQWILIDDVLNRKISVPSPFFKILKSV